MAKTATALREPARTPEGTGPAPDRTPARAAIGHNSGAMTWTDPSTGKVWTRGGSSGPSDSVLDFPIDLVPEGFTYQWVRESIYNQDDRANMVSRGRSGWQAVPADRHPDRVVKYDGLILMEMPTMFVEAARKEERAHALKAKATSMPGVNLPNGFDANHRGAQAHTFARYGREQAPDDLRPTYQREVSIDN